MENQNGSKKDFIPFKGTVKIHSVKRILDAFFKVDAARVSFEKINGGGTISPNFDVLNFERGDAVAAIVHDTVNGTIVLTEQFRYPTHGKTGGWILELPAGMFKAEEEDPLLAMKRELVEEVGYESHSSVHISTFYVSPGGTSERIWLYYMPVSPKDLTSQGGGLATESEAIARREIPIQQVFELMEKGVIMDAKTLIGIQWLKGQILENKIQQRIEIKKEKNKMASPKAERLATVTMQMVSAGTHLRLDIMEKVFSDLKLLQLGAVRTHRIWDKNAPVFSADEDPENFLNNLPGLIAAFKATEDHLMAENLFSPAEAEARIPAILKEIIEQPFPDEAAIRANPRALADLIGSNSRLRVRIELANATWATRVTSRVESDGEKFKRIHRVNSLIKLICPDCHEDETEDARVKRHMEVVKDQDQITVAAKWWLHILTDHDELVDELEALHQISKSIIGAESVAEPTAPES